MGRAGIRCRPGRSPDRDLGQRGQGQGVGELAAGGRVAALQPGVAVGVQRLPHPGHQAGHDAVPVSHQDRPQLSEAQARHEVVGAFQPPRVLR